MGRLCASLPESLVKIFCRFIGTLIACLPNQRRYLALSNLHHAFPQRSEKWRRKIMRASMCRLVEMGALGLASPFLSEARIRRMVTVPSSSEQALEPFLNGAKGAIFLSPHLTLLEANSFAPLVLQIKNKTVVSLFRPFDNPQINRFIQQTRQRWGAHMLSRHRDLKHVFSTVKQGGGALIFFDQNAGRRGTLVSFLGRIASATDLPERIATRYHVPVYMVYPRRQKFWRVELCIKLLEVPFTPNAITLGAHQALEDYLQSSDDHCADWLWAHSRWKLDEKPRRRMGLGFEKSVYDFSHNHSYPPSRSEHNLRFWIRLPDRWEQAVQAIPLIKQLRWSRPDATFALLAPEVWSHQLLEYALVEEVIALPSCAHQSLRQCWHLRKRYPDVLILLSQSQLGDFQAWLTGAPQRFGLALKGKKRSLLTHSWPVNTEQRRLWSHKTEAEMWSPFLRYFGLRKPEKEVF